MEWSSFHLRRSQYFSQCSSTVCDASHLLCAHQYPGCSSPLNNSSQYVSAVALKVYLYHPGNIIQDQSIAKTLRMIRICTHSSCLLTNKAYPLRFSCLFFDKTTAGGAWYRSDTICILETLKLSMVGQQSLFPPCFICLLTCKFVCFFHVDNHV